MRRSFAAFLGVLAAGLFAAACDNGPAPTTPTPGPTITETFTGTINLNGSQTHSFNATAAGAVTATITAIDPTGSLLGFQIGTWDTVTCRAVSSNDLATISSFLGGNTQSAASLCVRMHDPNGALTANPVNYTVTVTHQ
jgi:ABC-type glycerol-3-phosphate transport system substrate-binding protein